MSFAGSIPEEVLARLDRPMPWWKLLDNPDLSGDEPITREASSFAQKLSKFRIAVVPDPRVDAGGVTGDTQCMAFRVVSCTRHVTHDYEPAKAQLERDLAFLMVKGRPSPRELNWVRNRGFEAFRLDGESRERLMAWLELRLQEPIENAEDVVRAIGADRSIPWRGDQYARYRMLCEADGPLDALEYEALRLVKQDKGIPPRRQLSIFDAPVSTPEPEAAAPRPTAAPKPKPKTLALMLDASRIADISAQTREVGTLLGQVFKDDEAEPVKTAAVAVGKPGWRQALELVSERDSWPGEELFACWQRLGLMPQAVLDDLNERALDACDELLLEGEGPYDVNPTALQALRAAA